MRIKALMVLVILFTLVACAPPVATETPLPPVTITPTLSFDTPVPPTNTPAPGETAAPFITFTPTTQGPVSGVFNPYAVILVEADDVLNIRSGPGVENPVVGTLQPGASNVTRTGLSTTVAEDTWVEIQNPSGGTAWVNSNFLTEYVPSSTFCVDSRATALLQDLETAVKTSNGDLMRLLVSPKHGLDVTYIRNGTVANYSQEEAGWVFQSTYVVDWGPGAGSGEPVRGTFPEIVQPSLLDTYQNASLFCNEIEVGGTTYVANWPPKYKNINFYSLYNPGNDPAYEGLDWQTWLIGIEYVGEKPYLFALMYYAWEP